MFRRSPNRARWYDVVEFHAEVEAVLHAGSMAIEVIRTVLEDADLGRLRWSNRRVEVWNVY